MQIVISRKKDETTLKKLLIDVENFWKRNNLYYLNVIDLLDKVESSLFNIKRSLHLKVKYPLLDSSHHEIQIA